VISSAAASYYMILFNVDIGYGILAAALASDSHDQDTRILRVYAPLVTDKLPIFKGFHCEVGGMSVNNTVDRCAEESACDGCSGSRTGIRNPCG